MALAVRGTQPVVRARQSPGPTYSVERARFARHTGKNILCAKRLEPRRITTALVHKPPACLHPQTQAVL